MYFNSQNDDFRNNTRFPIGHQTKFPRSLLIFSRTSRLRKEREVPESSIAGKKNPRYVTSQKNYRNMNHEGKKYSEAKLTLALGMDYSLPSTAAVSRSPGTTILA
jgi:hypothetical protein